VKLLTDGTENNPLLGFCLALISRHAENWPPTEQVLAEEFINWLGVRPFFTRDEMRKLCLSKGINLSFMALPLNLRGYNCTFQDKKEIVISERENVPFADLHTLLHEFREMLEHVLVELGCATLTPEDSLEKTAEEFAILATMATGVREMPAYLEMVGNIKTDWQRYFGYAFVLVFFAAHMFSCAFLPQFEEMISEARRQRYVRT